MWKQICERWKSDTSAFFNKLKHAAIAVGTSATAVWTVNSTMGLDLSEPVLAVCKYTIAFCAAVGLTSQLTVKDPNKLTNV